MLNKIAVILLFILLQSCDEDGRPVDNYYQSESEEKPRIESVEVKIDQSTIHSAKYEYWKQDPKVIRSVQYVFMDSTDNSEVFDTIDYDKFFLFNGLYSTAEGYTRNHNDYYEVEFRPYGDTMSVQYLFFESSSNHGNIFYRINILSYRFIEPEYELRSVEIYLSQFVDNIDTLRSSIYRISKSRDNLFEIHEEISGKRYIVETEAEVKTPFNSNNLFVQDYVLEGPDLRFLFVKNYLTPKKVFYLNSDSQITDSTEYLYTIDPNGYFNTVSVISSIPGYESIDELFKITYK